MLGGRTALNVDAKGRMAIPTRYRERLQDTCDGRLVLTQHPFDRCLSLYPEDEWHRVAHSVASLPDSSDKVRYLKRRFLGQAVEVEMDSNGRFLVPAELRDLIQLDKKAMLVGQITRFEVWSEGGWLEEQKKYQEITPDEMPEAVQELAF